MHGDGLRNETGTEVGGIEVVLKDGGNNPILDAGGQPIVTSTDGLGAYRFSGLPVGDYRVEFLSP